MTFQPQTFNPRHSTKNSMVEKSGLKSPGLKMSWLKSLGLRGPGLKVGVVKSKVEKSFNHVCAAETLSETIESSSYDLFQNADAKILSKKFY